MNRILKFTFLCVLCAVFLSLNLLSQDDIIGFESKSWISKGAKVVNHLGRRCLIGTAYLKDVEFQNGVIEVDIAVNGKRSYPGIIFRIQSLENYERFYIRPHRAGLYPDALQYTPVFNGVAAWQLYSGPGFTAWAKIPANKWIHLKMEINGDQARLFIDNSPNPLLVIPKLKHGFSKGSIGIMGPKDNSAYFSNFKYKKDDNLLFKKPGKTRAPTNMIKEWEISKVYKANLIDIAEMKYPSFSSLFNAEWKSAAPDADGLVNISRFRKRSERGPDYVLARTVINAPKKEVSRLSFGYSDEVT
ncbi:MAG: hypothetical protein GY757_21705, partial [bacterium]|nr:hypothetical protein [bacterium]